MIREIIPGRQQESLTVSSIKCDRYWHLDWQRQGVRRPAGVARPLDPPYWSGGAWDPPVAGRPATTPPPGTSIYRRSTAEQGFGQSVKRQ